jgi:RimJ/RimL family protein N-acetyltransferase
MRIDLQHRGFYLSPIQNGDQAAYVEHFRDKATTDNLLKIPYPYTEEDAEAWVKSRLEAALKQPQETSFALRRIDGFLIGGIGLVLNSGAAEHRAELGYWVAKDYRGRGLATAAIRAMVQYAFQSLGLKRVEALAFSHNLISHRVLEKAGFKREGLLEGYHLKNGALQDACIYAVVRTEISPV